MLAGAIFDEKTKILYMDILLKTHFRTLVIRRDISQQYNSQ